MQKSIREWIIEHPRREGEKQIDYAERLSALSGYRSSAISGKERYWRERLEAKQEQAEMGIETDKKELDDEFDYTQILQHALESQKLYGKLNLAQSEAVWRIKTKQPVYVMFFGDAHIGASGMDIQAFMNITNEIINTPNLYVILLGDMMEMAIKMRSVHEVMGNIIPPKWQFKILESWLTQIQHKVICATWDNHAVMREENVLGYSPTAELLAKKVIYHSGIGHIDVHVNDIVYKLGVSHFFKGNSIHNPNHPVGRYIRHENCELDIAAQGDKHVPAIQELPISGRERVLIQCGTLNTNSGYAKRFYSLKTFDHMPVVRLDQNEKMVTPFMSIKKAQISLNMK